MKAKEFDQKFDEGKEDIIEELDLSQMRRPGHESKWVNVDFPLWMIQALDHEARRLGVHFVLPNLRNNYQPFEIIPPKLGVRGLR